MKIDKELVKKMADLSKVRLSEAEVSQLENEFREIFDYFSSIKEIGENEDMLFYVSGANLELRMDKTKMKTKDEVDGIVKNFSQKDKRLLLAPKTLE